MEMGPKSKTGQLADLLRERILAGAWSGSLPAERLLANEYLVSRSTLRAALKILESEDLLGEPSSTRSGRSLRIPSHSGELVENAGRVILLTPSLHDSPLLIEQVSTLREYLGASGIQVLVRESRQLSLSKRPKPMLSRIVSGHPGAVFVLHQMPMQVQLAACALHLPALVFGSVFEKVDLPCVDVDFAAVARHAAGRCLAKGHKRLAVLVHRTPLAGDEVIVDALIQELDRRGAPSPLVMKHDYNRARLLDALDREIVPAGGRPDALLIGNQHHMLSGLSHLLRRGVRVPDELSLVYLGNDPATERLSPLPDRYDLGDRMVRRLAVAIRTRLAGEKPKSQFLLPKMVKGETLR